MSGPRAHLDLAVARHPWAGTQLVRRRVRWPFALTNPFHLDTAPADMLTVVLQSASGAIVAGDRIAHRIEAGRGAALHVTSQAATAVHAMPLGMWAEDSGELIVGEHAFVELLPEPRVLFPRAELVQRLAVDIDGSAVAIVGDGFLSHDPSGRGEPFRRFAAETIVRDGAGRVLAVDRFDVSGSATEGSERPAHGWFTVRGARPSRRRDGDRSSRQAPSRRSRVRTREPPRRPTPRESPGVWRPGTARRCGSVSGRAGERPPALTGSPPPSRRKGGGASARLVESDSLTAAVVRRDPVARRP